MCITANQAKKHNTQQHYHSLWTQASLENPNSLHEDLVAFSTIIDFKQDDQPLWTMQYVNTLNSKVLIYKGPRSTRVEYYNIETMFMAKAIQSRSTNTFSDTKQRRCSESIFSSTNLRRKLRGNRPWNQIGLQVVRYQEDETMMAS